MFFFLTQFLRGVLGYSDLQTGFAFLPLTVTVFIVSQLSAPACSSSGSAPAADVVAGITLSTLGMLWLTQLSERQRLPGAARPAGDLRAGQRLWRSCR